MTTGECAPDSGSGARPAARMALVAFLALAVLGGAVFQIQALMDDAFPRRRVEQLLYLPSGAHLRPAVLGFDLVTADYFWLKTIGYFGGHYMADRKYPWLAHILNLVTDLDPRYRVVYYFGGLVLAVEASQVDESTALLKKGMKNLPEVWKFPFFVGFNYLYYKGDAASAAEYISRAATLPESPEYLPRLAASLYARSGRTDAAVAFLQTMERTVDDERLRGNLRRKIEDLKAGRIPPSIEKALSMGGS
jgi:hypothetical protein